MSIARHSISDATEFDRVTDALALDLMSAAVHYRLYKDLRQRLPDYTKEFNAARTFWWLTLQAHFQYALSCLARVYDQERSSVSLRRWLELIEANFDLLKKRCFAEPVISRWFELATGEVSRFPDLQRVKQDIHYSSNKNRLVKRLTERRNNLIGHRSLSHARRGTNLFAQFPLGVELLEELLEGALEIFNTYNEVFRQTALSPQIIGHDDYRFVLEAVREELKRLRKAPERTGGPTEAHEDSI